jgi:glycosyltransferase involved in cell wall biosynthesis
MNVALDARKLFDGGVGSYIRGLLPACALQAREHSFTALVDPRDLGRVAWSAPVHEAPVRAGKYGLAEHFVVPAAARRLGVQLLHEPHYTLPLGWNGRSVVTIHDLIHIRFGRFFPPGASLYARAMAGIAAARADRVIVDSEHTGRDVIELLHVPEGRVRVVHLGVSPQIARPATPETEAFRASRALPRDYLLYVGARKRHKNLELLIDALATLPPGTRPALVLSGGRPAPEEPLARRVRERGLSDAVHYAGRVTDDRELSCLYAGAALYVHPSLAEGFGLPPLEAMACGTPVLSSNAASLPEVLGDAAVLLPPADPRHWASEITRLLSDAAERARLVERGLARARTFTWERAARQTLLVYAEALEGR